MLALFAPCGLVGKSSTAEAELLAAGSYEKIPERANGVTGRPRPSTLFGAAIPAGRERVVEMSIKRTRERCPDKLPCLRIDEFVPASRNGHRVMGNAAYISLGLVALLLSGHSQGAEVIPYCEAKRYKACPSFSTSVTIGDHVKIIDASFSGFARSKGSWTIDVRYQPEESCAIVKMLLNMGPIDAYRSYERILTGGAGQVSDRGSFMHKTDSLESALKAPSPR